MATLEKIDLLGPVLLDPAQHDLDCHGSVKQVSGVDSITLTGADASTFYAWVAEFWKELFEQDLQGLSTSEEHGDLLTTWLPLVTFREGLCTYAGPRKRVATAALLDKLRTLTRHWRDNGVDEVYISGVDLSAKKAKQTA